MNFKNRPLGLQIGLIIQIAIFISFFALNVYVITSPRGGSQSYEAFSYLKDIGSSANVPTNAKFSSMEWYLIPIFCIISCVFFFLPQSNDRVRIAFISAYIVDIVSAFMIYYHRTVLIDAIETELLGLNSLVGVNVSDYLKFGMFFYLLLFGAIIGLILLFTLKQRPGIIGQTPGRVGQVPGRVGQAPGGFKGQPGNIQRPMYNPPRNQPQQPNPPVHGQSPSSGPTWDHQLDSEKTLLLNRSNPATPGQHNTPSYPNPNKPNNFQQPGSVNYPKTPQKITPPIVVLSGPKDLKVFQLPSIIGSNPQKADVYFPGTGIAEKHLVLNNYSGDVLISASGAGVGTKINGHDIKPKNWYRLYNGQEIQLGNDVFHVKINEQMLKNDSSY